MERSITGKRKGDKIEKNWWRSVIHLEDLGSIVKWIKWRYEGHTKEGRKWGKLWQNKLLMTLGQMGGGNKFLLAR